MGPKAWGLELKNIRTQKGDKNREINEQNLRLDRIILQHVSATAVSRTCPPPLSIGDMVNSQVGPRSAVMQTKKNVSEESQLPKKGRDTNSTAYCSPNASSLSQTIATTDSRIVVPSWLSLEGSSVGGDIATSRPAASISASPSLQIKPSFIPQEPQTAGATLYVPLSFRFYEDEVRDYLPHTYDFDRPIFAGIEDSDFNQTSQSALAVRELVLDGECTIDDGLYWLIGHFPFADRYIGGIRIDYAPRIDGAKSYDERARLICEMFQQIHKKINAATLSDAHTRQQHTLHVREKTAEKKAQKAKKRNFKPGISM